jgi:hypothetical protein
MPDQVIEYAIVESLGTLNDDTKGWTKELNLVSWRGRDAKLDLREWGPDHSKAGKGLTLSKEEAKILSELLTEYLKKK